MSTDRDDEKQVVTFLLGDNEFGIDIMNVREITKLNELNRISRTPDLPEAVLGVMPLRGSILPIVSLKKKLGVTGSCEEDIGSASRIIIVNLHDTGVGLMVDSVNGVSRIAERDITPIPDFIDGYTEYISNIYKPAGNRLVMLINISALMAPEEQDNFNKVAGDITKKGELVMTSANDAVDEKQLVCFMIEDEEYGIDIMGIQEIIRVGTIIKVPGSPEFVNGIVNLRGDVLPVISLRTLFGLDSRKISEQNRILVVNTDKKTVGVMVDSVSEVIRIPCTAIEPAPEIIRSEERGKYIDGVGKLDSGDRIIIMLSMSSMLNG